MSQKSELVTLTAEQMSAKLKSGEISARELTQAELDVIDAAEPSIRAFLARSSEEALAQADAVDKRRAKGEELPDLAGVPVAVKDMIVTKGIETTAASKILKGWIPPYDATVVARMKRVGMPILGKTNLDEFAQGSSTETSAFHPTFNPWDTTRVPGGSGGGSASAVASFESPLALGTDTGGSIRQPAAFTGTVGVKSTYGHVSRYGAIAMASSLDQVGPCARTVTDAAMLYDVIAGYDDHDSTSLPGKLPSMAAAAVKGARRDLKGLRIGIVKEATGDGFEPEVNASFNEGIELLEAMGAEVKEMSFPNFLHGIRVYYVIMPAEVSSNLARYDGMRYGLRVMPPAGVPQTAANMMACTREAGFGPEVKRRIILGTYALSAGKYDEWYGKAQRVRTVMIQDFAKAFRDIDVLVCPTAPTSAFKLGEIQDPATMYRNDIATIPANLAGLPALSIPSGLDGDGLPTGFQIMAAQRHDDTAFTVASALESAFTEKWGAPIWTKMKTPWLDSMPEE